MAVSDHGLEVLKKAAVEITPGDKSEYVHRVRVLNFAEIGDLIDQVESLLTTIRDNADQLEGFTDGVEGLLTAGNTLLTTIRDNADQIEGFVDGLEGLITTSNSLLTEISGKISSDTSTLSNVEASASSVTLLAANASREGFILYNDSNRDCLIKYGATASASSFTFFMGPNSLHKETFPVYRGRIDAIWTAASGNMRITELT